MPETSGPQTSPPTLAAGSATTTGAHAARWAVVLAGGASSRMGREKAALRLDGRDLLSHVVSAAARFGPVVVVAPDAVAARTLDAEARAHVRAVALEDPPLGGPVAGLAAGVAALPDDAEEVVVLACDLPRADRLVEAVSSPAADAALARAEGVCPVDDEGYRQLLAARYRAEALRSALAALPSTRDVSVRRLVAPLHLAEVPAAAGATADVDDPDAAARHGVERP